MPYVAYTIMGKGGVVAVLVMLFQAITSAMSSGAFLHHHPFQYRVSNALLLEIVAVTSLVTYDFYRSYVDPGATGKQLLFVSHIAVVGFGLVTAAIAIGLVYAGTSVSFIVTAIGIIIDGKVSIILGVISVLKSAGAVIPSACTLFWRKQSRHAVIWVPLLSSVASISTWVGVAYHQYGFVSIDSLSAFVPTVAGNMLALLAPVVLTPLITYIRPEDYDFEKFKELRQVDDTAFFEASSLHVATQTADEKTEEALEHHELIKQQLLQARNIALALALFIAISMTILWPIPMYSSGYVFSKPFFTGWVVVTFVWGFFGAITITCVPLWESRKDILLFFRVLLTGEWGSKEESDGQSVADVVPALEKQA